MTAVYLLINQQYIFHWPRVVSTKALTSGLHHTPCLLYIRYSPRGDLIKCHAKCPLPQFKLCICNCMSEAYNIIYSFYCGKYGVERPHKTGNIVQRE